MASVEVESIPAVEINPAPITLETPASPESPEVVEPPAAPKETPEEIEATQSVVDLPDSEDPGATKKLEDEVSAEVAEDVAAPPLEPAAEEIKIKDETEEKEEAPPAAETEPTPTTAEELKAPAELEAGPDPPKLLEEEEKAAEVAE